MVKFLLFVLLIWLIKKIAKLFKNTLVAKNYKNKQGSNNKTGMHIIDADYEEIE